MMRFIENELIEFQLDMIYFCKLFVLTDYEDLFLYNFSRNHADFLQNFQNA